MKNPQIPGRPYLRGLYAPLEQGFYFRHLLSRDVPSLNFTVNFNKVVTNTNHFWFNFYFVTLLLILAHELQTRGTPIMELTRM